MSRCLSNCDIRACVFTTSQDVRVSRMVASVQSQLAPSSLISMILSLLKFYVLIPFRVINCFVDDIISPFLRISNDLHKSEKYTITNYYYRALILLNDFIDKLHY